MLRQVVGRWAARPAATTAAPAATSRLPSTVASAIEQVQAELRRRLLKALRHRGMPRPAPGAAAGDAAEHGVTSGVRNQESGVRSQNDVILAPDFNSLPAAGAVVARLAVVAGAGRPADGQGTLRHQAPAVSRLVK